VDTLDSLNLEFPSLDKTKKKELAQVRKLLVSDK